MIDGEHYAPVIRDALVELPYEVVAAVLVGGTEKLRGGEDYGVPLAGSLEEAIAEHAPDVVLDLSDEPVLGPPARLRLAARALVLGVPYEGADFRLDPPRFEEIATPSLAVIGTAKRAGKTAVAAHWAGLLRERGTDPVIGCMGRGGPAEPRTAPAGIGIDELLEIAERGEHAASDYLEDAALAGVATVGCRRVGGGFAGQPFESNVAAGGALAASLGPGAIVFEGSGACIPPVEVDRTVCVVGRGAPEPFAEYRLMRADLVLAMEGSEAPPGAVPFELRPEPAEPLPDGARVALFTTGAERCQGVEPVVASANLARRSALAGDLDRAAAERCDVYLTELKAAAIDTVARRARAEGARVVLVRNRPLGADDALLGVWGGA